MKHDAKLSAKKSGRLRSAEEKFFNKILLTPVSGLSDDSAEAVSEGFVTGKPLWSLAGADERWGTSGQ